MAWKPTAQVMMVAAGFVVLAGVGGSVCYVRHCRSELSRRAEAIRRYETNAGGERQALQDQVGQLLNEKQILSNRVSEIQFLYDEEKKTNEPLRRQVEKMLAQEIAARVRIEKLESENREQADRIQKAQAELTTARNEIAALQAKLQDVTRQQEAATQQQTSANGELQKAAERIKQLEKDLVDAGALQAKTKSELETVVSARDQLQKDLEALRQKVPAQP